MKHIYNLLLVLLLMAIQTGCYDREVIDQKEFDHSLPNVENLSYSRQGDVITLNWDIPGNITDEFKRPIEVSIQVVEDNIYRQKVVVRDENESVNIAVVPTSQYRFVVKLLGYLNAEAREEGLTDRVYSSGVVIEIE